MKLNKFAFLACTIALTIASIPNANELNKTTTNLVDSNRIANENIVENIGIDKRAEDNEDRTQKAEVQLVRKEFLLPQNLVRSSQDEVLNQRDKLEENPSGLETKPDEADKFEQREIQYSWVGAIFCLIANLLGSEACDNIFQIILTIIIIVVAGFAILLLVSFIVSFISNLISKR